MKFYIAARTSEISKVREMANTLISLGHEITHDWTAMEDSSLGRPYTAHIEKVSLFAEKDIIGAATAELFIIIGDKFGTGMYVEMGAALANKAKVYAIGEYNDLTVFHFHPHVKRVDTFAEVLKDLDR